MPLWEIGALFLLFIRRNHCPAVEGRRRKTEVETRNEALVAVLTVSIQARAPQLSGLSPHIPLCVSQPVLLLHKTSK